MPVYELRTYTLYVGKLAEAVKLYQELAWPALQAGGFDAKLIGYFTSDVGTLSGSTPRNVVSRGAVRLRLPSSRARIAL